MGTDSCLFAVRVDSPALTPVVHERARALAGLYASRSDLQPSIRTLAGGCIVVGALPLDDGPPPVDGDAVWSWGEAAGRFTAASQLLAADDSALRSLLGVGAWLAADESQARFVHAPSGATALYRAAGDVCVWSTHAIAAAWLAAGRVELDLTRLPELLAFDFVGGSGTLVPGVAAVPPAMSVWIDASGVREQCYWSPASRWDALDAADAQRAAERALVESLAARLADERAPRLALTAGLDSRVVALALAEGGVQFEAFTWGERDWPDASGARELAHRLDVMHRVYPPQWLSEEAAMAELKRQAVRGDGVAPLPLSIRAWPAGGSAYVTGMGGETGRAFYYSHAHARGELLDVFNVEARLRGASPDALESARDACAGWLRLAAASGRDGWSLLDVVYAEQRVAHWGRSQYPALRDTVLPAFIPVEVARALSSLPLEDRLTSAFHHRFLNSRGIETTAPGPSRKRPFARRALGRLRRRGSPPPGDPLLVALWRDRPQLRAWLADEVLAQPALADAMGEAWVDATRQGFLEGQRRAAEKTQLAAGVFALETQLAGLASDLRPAISGGR